MGDVPEPNFGPRLGGRSLYIGAEGELYVARKYAIYRSSDWGRTWHLDSYVPAGVRQRAAHLVRPLARLLRYDVMAFQVMADGTRLAVARDGVYRAERGETRMARVFRVMRGSRPINLTVDGKRVLFGEYGSYFGWRSDVLIYVSDDGGRTFETGYRFDVGDIMHVHNIVVDPYQDEYWVLTGDVGHEPGIALLSKDMRTLEWVRRGSQQYRAVQVLVYPDYLMYGTDSNSERNFIVRFDKRSGKTSKLIEIQGSSHYASEFGPVRLISTTVEPNPVWFTRQCALYASFDGDRWRRVVTHRKDRYHTRYFQFGKIILPYAHHQKPRGMYSGQSLVGMDEKVSLVDFS